MFRYKLIDFVGDICVFAEAHENLLDVLVGESHRCGRVKRVLGDEVLVNERRSRCRLSNGYQKVGGHLIKRRECFKKDRVVLSDPDRPLFMVWLKFYILRKVFAVRYSRRADITRSQKRQSDGIVPTSKVRKGTLARLNLYPSTYAVEPITLPHI